MKKLIVCSVLSVALVALLAIPQVGAWKTEREDVVFTGLTNFINKVDLTKAKIMGASALVFEGATDNAYRTTFVITDPTAARTITFPNSSGTVPLNPTGLTWQFNGSSYTSTITQTEPTGNRTITLPNATGTVPLASSANGLNFTVGDFLLSTTTVSLAADGNTTIFTVPVGMRCVLNKAMLVAAADAGTSTMTIGQTGALTDFLNTQTLSAVDAQYDVAVMTPVPNATPALRKSYAAGTVIKAAVGSHAGSAGNTLYLFGFCY